MKRKSRASKRYQASNKKPKHVQKESDEAYSDESNEDLSPDHHGLTFGPPEDELSPEEVLPITDDDDDIEDEEEGHEWEKYQDDDDDDSDDVKKDDSENLVNLESWGRKKSTYYSADFVDEDRGRSYREEDNEAAKTEERDALAIQKSFLENIHSSAYDVMPFSITESTVKEPVEETSLNWDAITKEQKLQILARRNPEFLPLLHELKDKMIELKELLPCMDEPSANDKSLPHSDYLRLRTKFLLHYCTNISFYMTLKSAGESVTNHPVVKKIQEYKELLNKLDKNDPRPTSKARRPIIAETSNSKKLKREISKMDTLTKKVKGSERPTKSKTKRVHFETEEEKEVLQAYAKNNKLLGKANLVKEKEAALEFNETKNSEEPLSKRSVTYQIAKNKGLIAKRSKEYRNPRVRNRNKFRKAEIRRKGQVQKLRTETTRYGGEHSGIHAYVSRSIKLK